MSKQSTVPDPSTPNPAWGGLLVSQATNSASNMSECSDLVAELIIAGARALACTDRGPLTQIALSRCEAGAAAVILAALKKMEEAGTTARLADLIQAIQSGKGSPPLEPAQET
jgi:hypothetical protein